MSERVPTATRASLTHVLPVLFACSALFAACQALDWIPSGLRFSWLASAPALFLAAAWPLVLRWTPTDPSPHKLFILSLVLSPWLIALGWWGLSWWLPAPTARAAVFLAVAALQLLAWGRRPHAQAAGSASIASWLVGAGLAAGVLFLLARGDGAATWLADGVPWQLGLAHSFERGPPLENPWLAGTSPPSNPAFAALLAVAARTLDFAPLRAMAMLAGVSVLATAGALYHLAAPLWLEPRRAFLSVALGLLGGAAGLGLQRGALRAPFEHGLSGFLDPGVLPSGLALAAVALMCAAHALRHAARPWVGLMALSVGLLALIDPLLGLTLLIGLAIGAAVAGGTTGVSVRVFAALMMAGVPAALALREWGDRVQPLPEALQQIDLRRQALRLILPLAFAVGLIGGRWRRAAVVQDEQDSGRRTILRLLLVATAVCIVSPFVAPELARRQDDLARMAALPAGVLAAGGWVDLWQSGKLARGLALVGALLLVVGAGRGLRAGVSATYDRGGQAWEFGSELRESVGEAYAWLRANVNTIEGLDRALLVRRPDESADHLQRNLAPHEAPLLSGMPMYCDWNDSFAADRDLSRVRRDHLARLFGFSSGADPEQEWDPRLFAEFDANGRPLVVLVEPSDRDRSRTRLAQRLPLLGCQPLRSFGDVDVWWRPAGGVKR